MRWCGCAKIGNMIKKHSDPQPKRTHDIQAALASQLRDRPEILFGLLYGSAAEGHPFQDLDVGVYVDRARVPPDLDVDYGFSLAEELNRRLPYPVDVRVMNDAPLAFRYNVSCGTPLIVNDREAFLGFLERTWDEYLDFQPIAMQYLKELA